MFFAWFLFFSMRCSVVCDSSHPSPSPLPSVRAPVAYVLSSRLFSCLPVSFSPFLLFRLFFVAVRFILCCCGCLVPGFSPTAPVNVSVIA